MEDKESTIRRLEYAIRSNWCSDGNKDGFKKQIKQLKVVISRLKEEIGFWSSKVLSRRITEWETQQQNTDIKGANLRYGMTA